MEDRSYYVRRDAVPEGETKWTGFFALEEARELAKAWAAVGCTTEVVRTASDSSEDEIVIDCFTGQASGGVVVEHREGPGETGSAWPVGQQVSVPSCEEDRREHERHAVSAPVLVVLVDRDGRHFWGSSRDISRGGMYVCTEEQVEVDWDVSAKIVLLTEAPIKASARVVRSHAGKGFGCCFTHLPSQSVQRLDRWLGRSGGLRPVSGVIET